MLATTDSELVTNIQSGHTEFESALYERYAARVYYLALRESRSPQDAEDIRAEAFLRVLQAIRSKQLRSAQSLPSFILGVVRNVLHEFYARRQQMDNTVPAEDAELTTPSHEHAFLDQEVRAAIEKAIKRLKPREQLVLKMLIYDELSPAEVATRVSIPQERVRLVKSRALKHFREIYERLNRTSYRHF